MPQSECGTPSESSFDTVEHLLTAAGKGRDHSLESHAGTEKGSFERRNGYFCQHERNTISSAAVLAGARE